MHLGSVLVTGGSGSLGRAIAKRLLQFGEAERVIILSRNEHRQEQMERELAPLDGNGRMRYRVGDVRDLNRLLMAFRGVDTVIHAAAMKVVRKCEDEPSEAVLTNVVGAMNVVTAALERNVSRVVAVSTDKSVSPANLYGATKLCAEKLFLASNVYSGTRFSCVRYGNVAGSQGSVIPLWQSLIASGETTVPVTSPFCTRYWLTLDEAVDLVLWAAKNASGGEVIVPEMPAYQLSTLAEALDVKQKIVGLRPGEKLNEDMVADHEYAGFSSIGKYWISGSQMAGAGLNLKAPMRSDDARRMSVDELRAALGMVDEQRVAA